jgi:hypothetical protein
LAEVTFGMLALCPHYTRLSALVFATLMVGATSVHYQLGEPVSTATMHEFSMMLLPCVLISLAHVAYDMFV